MGHRVAAAVGEGLVLVVCWLVLSLLELLHDVFLVDPEQEPAASS